MGVVALITLRLRARTKWTALLVYLLTASLGYGGLSLCIAADGDFGEGYDYCCRYWCDAGPLVPERAHSYRCAPSSAGLERGNGEVYPCRDYAVLALPRERDSEVRRSSPMQTVDGLPADPVGPALLHETARTAQRPRLHQIFHSIIYDPLSVILLL